MILEITKFFFLGLSATDSDDVTDSFRRLPSIAKKKIPDDRRLQMAVSDFRSWICKESMLTSNQ